ncbi:NapC/NirT family cytochrome c [Bisgaard Taxon 10/6]|uniref:NapC/NirT family cytochrome c n=1 Tax=Exercitatus varius TaxID=67857 RepID=UPI00294B66DC|nr:NapC/NirT family cytochrome c [Exercitatus varius]MDG2915897.1 NapC/NirT family cytochrome c [Exercitatus varius]
MAKRKISLIGGLVLMGLGAAAVLGVQKTLKATNSTEFCVSCHSMAHPKAEWEGSAHFSNAQGIRADCADCHVPQENGLHYLKAKFIALKDLWYTVTDKLPDKQAYEQHRAEMAKTVWEEMKANDSETCRSCHSFGAMEISAQKPAAQDFHTQAKENGQTCIDCHKGIVHFLPEDKNDNGGDTELAKHGGQLFAESKVLYALAVSTAKSANGGEVRLMPFAELTDWKAEGENVAATLHGWQQAGAESVLYTGLGQRITVAVLDDEAKANLQVKNKVHDSVTDSEWSEVMLSINAPKNAVTSDINSLNAFGKNLNETHCSGCHAPIAADHYTANQWIGVVNSMKDRTSMTKEQVRALTIYLQRNAK